MDSRELELIALRQLISRYRVGLTNDGQLSVPDLKAKLSAGASVDDPDIEVSIGNLSTESNVTIVEQTVECDEHSHEEHHEEHLDPTTNETEHQDTESPPSEQPKETLGGRLFKFFKDNKNDPV